MKSQCDGFCQEKSVYKKFWKKMYTNKVAQNHTTVLSYNMHNSLLFCLSLPHCISQVWIILYLSANQIRY